MRVVRHSTPESFKQFAFPYLLQEEATHNLLIGIISRYPDAFPADAYFSHIENASGTVIGAAMRTPPHGAVLSAINDEAAITLLVQDYADMYETLPSAMGAAEDTKLFVDLWSRRSGQDYELHMQQGIYKLETVISVQNVSGEYRSASVNERELIIDWYLAFHSEALGEISNRDEVAKIVDRKLANQVLDALRIWWDKGHPVSIVGSTRLTPNGISIGPVYTPPELRGRGYGSAVTAAISQELLDSGRKFCFLYTDMSNLTSNKIYQNIGYELVCHQHFYQFSDPA